MWVVFVKYVVLVRYDIPTVLQTTLFKEEVGLGGQWKGCFTLIMTVILRRTNFREKTSNMCVGFGAFYIAKRSHPSGLTVLFVCLFFACCFCVKNLHTNILLEMVRKEDG